MKTLKTTPWKHQADCLEKTKDEEFHAILFEQRCGKTWVGLGTALHLYTEGHIDAVCVLAPNGVHRNWVTDEIPKHWPDHIPILPFIWRSNKAHRKSYQADLEKFLSARARGYRGLAFFAMNIDAIITIAGKKALKRFLSKHRCLLMLDESDVIASPGAKRTKTAMAARNYAPYRRILTGTVAAEGPLDLYSQYNFLSKSILGYDSFVAFKSRYAEYIEKETREGHPYKVLVSYLNLDELNKKIEPYSTRVTRKEVSDAPPKIYAKLYFDLTNEQRSAYVELREKYITELREGTISAANVLARYTRLQQIASNIAVFDQSAELCGACGGNGGTPEEPCSVCDGLGLVVPAKKIEKVGLIDPRLNMLEEDKKRVTGQSIVWCRFDRDVDSVMSMLRDLGRKPVQYDGRIGEEQRDINKRAFQCGDASDFVGKTSSGGRGLDLSCAETVYNYSHYFALRLRLQGEDRAEGIMKKYSTAIVDLIAEDTVDELMVDALREKKKISDIIVGDDPEKWI